MKLINAVLKGTKEVAYRKERAWAVFITITYLLGNGIEYFLGKLSDDPAILWIAGVLLGLLVLIVPLTKKHNLTSPIFKLYLFYINFNIIYAYATSTRGDEGIEIFYLLMCYVLFMVISQALDSRRELLLYTAGEIILFVLVVYFFRQYEPLFINMKLGGLMHLMIFGFVLVGNFLINIQRLKLTQVSLDSTVQFKSISENARDLQVIMNDKFQFIHINPAVLDLIGYSVQEASGMKLRDLIHPDDFDKVVEGLKQAIAHPEKRNSLEVRAHKNNGEYIWVETVLSSFHAKPNSKELLVFAEVRDISERKELEEEINLQLVAEGLLIKHSNRFINVDRTDMQGGIDAALADFGNLLKADAVLIYRLHGKLSDEFRSTNQWYSQPDSSLNSNFNLVVKINQELLSFLLSLRGGNVSQGTFVDANRLAELSVLGATKNIAKQFFIIPLPSGRVVNGFIIFVFDAAAKQVQSRFFGLIANMVANAFARLRTEIRLHEAQLTNEFILRALPDWLYIVNKAGEFTGTNNYSSHEPYIPDDNLIGKRLSDVLPDHIADDYTGALSEVIAVDAPVSFEYFDDTIHKNRYFKTIIAPFKANEYLIIVRDITELKHAQSELEQKAVNLELSNQELEQFAYVVSHDMKQPIRTVISYLSLLKRKYTGAIDDTGMEYINYSIEGANKMNDLIRDILQYSRIEHQVSFVGDVSIGDIVSKVCKNLKDTLTTSNAEVLADFLPVISGNDTMLTELFQNLIENGIKYNKSEKRTVQIHATESGLFWKFEISDNGIGFDEQYAHQIFKMFKRLHSDAEFPGTGIGLTICQKVVEKHGGKIWAHSEIGKGSTFLFTLPKDQKLN